MAVLLLLMTVLMTVRMLMMMMMMVSPLVLQALLVSGETIDAGCVRRRGVLSEGRLDVLVDGALAVGPGNGERHLGQGAPRGVQDSRLAHRAPRLTGDRSVRARAARDTLDDGGALDDALLDALEDRAPRVVAPEARRDREGRQGSGQRREGETRYRRRRDRRDPGLGQSRRWQRSRMVVTRRAVDPRQIGAARRRGARRRGRRPRGRRRIVRHRNDRASQLRTVRPAIHDVRSWNFSVRLNGFRMRTAELLTTMMLLLLVSQGDGGEGARACSCDRRCRRRCTRCVSAPREIARR